MAHHDMGKESFSVSKRAKSFVHAGRGIRLFFRTTHNAWVHSAVFMVAVVLGVTVRIDRIEWALLVFAGGLVFVAEALNTAIEVDMDLTSPEYHPYARDTKDIAAGAVLIASSVALLVGAIVFFPHIFHTV
ncbi:MAG: diacylglycerol kinase family protein [Minisyncoccota bacterium]